MVRVSGREYNGLLESPCYQRGALSCVSCHSMHDERSRSAARARPRRRRGLHAVPRRHRRRTSRRTRTTAPARRDRRATTAICRTRPTALARDAQPSDQRPARTGDRSTTGRPNACNLCHLDRTLAWTAAALARWYGTPAPPLSGEQRTVAASVLDVARGDAGRARADRVEHGLERGARGVRQRLDGALLIELLGDDYAAIRYIAYRSLRRISGFADSNMTTSARPKPASRRSARRASAGRIGRLRRDRRPSCCYERDGRFQRGELERLRRRARRRRPDVPRRMSDRTTTTIAGFSCATCVAGWVALLTVRRARHRARGASRLQGALVPRCRHREPALLVDAGARARRRARPGQPRARGRLPALAAAGCSGTASARSWSAPGSCPAASSSAASSSTAAIRVSAPCCSAGRAARPVRAGAHRARLLRIAPAMTSAPPTPRSAAPLTTSGVASCASSNVA